MIRRPKNQILVFRSVERRNHLGFIRYSKYRQNFATQTYTVPNVTKGYKMYRWRVTENHGSGICVIKSIELNGYQVESVGDPAGVSFSGEIVAGEGAQTTYYAMAFADPTLSRDYVVTQMVNNNHPNAMIGDTAIASDQTYALSNQLLANVVDGLGAPIPAALVNNATVYLYAVDTLGNKDMQVVSVLPAFDSVPRVTMASLTVNPNNIVVTGGSVYSCNGVITKVYQPVAFESGDVTDEYVVSFVNNNNIPFDTTSHAKYVVNQFDTVYTITEYVDTNGAVQPITDNKEYHIRMVAVDETGLAGVGKIIDVLPGQSTGTTSGTVFIPPTVITVNITDGSLDTTDGGKFSGTIEASFESDTEYHIVASTYTLSNLEVRTMIESDAHPEAVVSGTITQGTTHTFASEVFGNVLQDSTENPIVSSTSGKLRESVHLRERRQWKRSGLCECYRQHGGNQRQTSGLHKLRD